MSLGSFFVIMSVAAALTLLRGFTVASILPPEFFGIYATVVASGTFFGIVISFGVVEQSWKAFPRLWAQGHSHETVHLSRAMDQILLLRLVAVTAVAATGSGLFFGWQAVQSVIAAGAVGACVALTSAGSSYLRASGELKYLGCATFVRAILALVLSFIGARFLSWPGAILGEIMGALAFIAFVERDRRRLNRRSPEAVGTIAPTQTHEEKIGGRLVYLAGIMTAAPIYLDRLFVHGVMEPSYLGTYAFLMLFNLGAVTVVGILAQKTGPDVIRMGSGSAAAKRATGYMAKWLTGIALLLAVGLAVAASAVFLTPLSFLAEKYDLTVGMFLALTALCVGHVSVFLDWVLIGQNVERWVVAAALALLVSTGLAFALQIGTQLSVSGLIWLLAAAKWMQVLVQIVGLLMQTGRRFGRPRGIG